MTTPAPDRPPLTERSAALFGSLLVALGPISMALYTPAMRATLETDMDRIPELIGTAGELRERGAAPAVPSVDAPRPPEPTVPAAPPPDTSEQLGLF